MKQAIYTLILAASFIKVDANCPEVDPCQPGNHVELDDATRSTSYIYSGDAASDYDLPLNWYVSVSGAGGDMPTTALQTGQCNALGPIYLMGTLPGNPGEVVEMNACASFLTDSCIRQYSIMVKNCGDFNAYCLQRTTDAYDRYCFGSESECPEGEYSENGFTPCTQDAPAIDTSLTEDPVVTVNVSYEQDIDSNDYITLLECLPYYVFSCDIEHIDANALFDVRWYANDVLIDEHIEENAVMYTELPSMINSTRLIHLGYRLGTTVTCRINARDGPSEDANIGAHREASFFAGVQVEAESQFIELFEGGQAGFYNATFTIPYRCQMAVIWTDGVTCDAVYDSQGCQQLSVGVGRVEPNSDESCPSNPDVTVEVDVDDNNGCLIDIDEYQMSMKIFPVPDGRANPSKQRVLQPIVGENQNEFWANASLPRAVVRVSDTDVTLAGRYCLIKDDPHQLSFDGTNIWSEVQLEGAFLLYKHKHLPISVEVYFQSTGTHYTRNCGGAVRAGGEVFVYDDCRQGEPTRVTLYECEEGLQHMHVVENPDRENSYKITLSTGTVIILGTGRQYVYPSIFDWEQTEGLCGNLNGIDSIQDDKIIRGTNQPDMGTPMWGRRAHNVFSNSYRISDEDTLYYGYVRDELDFDDIYFCDCGDINNPGANCSSVPNIDNCLAGDHTEASGNRHRCTYSRRRRRQLEQQQQSDDFDDTPLTMFNFDPDSVAEPRGWDEVWNETTAREHCEQIFLSSASAMACQDVPNTNMSETINSCIMDIYITGTSEHSRVHVDVFTDICQHELELYDFVPEDESVQLPISPDVARLIRSQVCPGDCSGHGQCVEGACVCDEDYAEADCSIYMHHVTTLFALPSNGTCDKSSRPCELSVVFGDIFLQSSVHCKIQLRNVEGEALTDEVIVDAEYVHSQKIFCPISLEDFDEDFVSVGSYVIDTSMEDYDSGALVRNGSLNIDVSINNYEGDFSINVGDFGGQIVNMGPYIIDISVNNHDGEFSEMQQLYVYDGNCWNCEQGACMPLANKCHGGPTCYDDRDQLNGTSCLICDGASGNFLVQADSCLIDGRCFSNGEVLSDTDCHICSADSGLAELASNFCYIDGMCFETGQENPGNANEVCDASTDVSSWQIIGDDPAIDTSLTEDPIVTVNVAYEPDINSNDFITFLVCLPYYVFSCGIEHSDANALFDVRWYANDVLIDEHVEENAIIYNELPSVINSTRLIHLGYRLGTTVTCRINARDGPSEDANIGAHREASFFAGVQAEAESRFIELFEGGQPGFYNATFTIPYRCQMAVLWTDGLTCDEVYDSQGCQQLSVGVGRIEPNSDESCPSNPDVTVEVDDNDYNGCLIDIDEYQMSMKIFPVPDGRANPSKQRVLQPIVGENENEFWAGASLPRAVVRVSDADVTLGGRFCSMSDDPHQISFDGSSWSEVQLEGAFLMYKHTHLPISVEVYFQSTGSHWTRNCGGAVRAGGEVFVYDDCRQDEPTRVTPYECEEGLQHMHVERMSNYYSSYKITLSTGTVVILGRGSQYVYPSIFDWEQTEGLCGNLNGIDSIQDDKIKRGTNQPDMGTPIWGRLAHNDFSNSYRISDEDTLYYGYVRDELDFDDIYFCDCGDINNPGANCSSVPNIDNCLAGDHTEASGNRHRCTYSRRRRRQLEQQQQTDDFDDTPLTMFNFDPDSVAEPRGWGEVWNEITAREHCEQIFLSSASAMACQDVPNTNMSETINSCIMDIYITGTSEHSRVHVNVFTDICQHELEFYDFVPEDESVQLPISPDVARLIRSQVCPGDCSGHGQCVEGAYVCDEDYAEADCFIYMHHVPTLFALPSNGNCDKSSRPCELSVVFGDIFLQSSVHCKIQLRNVEGEALTDEVIVDAEFVHSQKIFCPISLEDFDEDFVSVGSYAIDTSMEDYDTGALVRNGSLNIDVSINNYEGDFSINVGDLGGQIVNMGPYIIDISVNNHDGDFSGMQQLYVYDGICWDCIQGACMPLANKCHVGPTCYEDGDELDGTSCLICDGASGNFIVQADSCLIDGRCFGNGEVLSDTDCRICIADSGLAELPPNSCYLDGECFAGGERVNGSLCHECNGATGLVVQTTNTCYFGDVCYSDGETNRESECHICDGATAELVLNSDFCYIDGMCFETEQANPGNANEVCDASIDDSSWQIIGGCREYNLTYNRRRRFDFKVTKAENKLELLPKHALLGSGRSITMGMRHLAKAVVVIELKEDTITLMTVRRFCMETTRVKKVTFEFFDIDGNKIKRGVRPSNYCLLEEEIPGIRKVKMIFKKKNGKDSVKISDLQMIACRD